MVSQWKESAAGRKRARVRFVLALAQHDPKEVAAVLSGERPGVSAAVLALLPRGMAARICQQMDGAYRSEVLVHLASGMELEADLVDALMASVLAHLQRIPRVHRTKRRQKA